MGHERRVEPGFVDAREHTMNVVPREFRRREFISGDNHEITQAKPAHRIDPVQSGLRYLLSKQE